LVPLQLHELGHGKDIISNAMFKKAIEQKMGGHLWLQHIRRTQVSAITMIWGESLDLSRVI
jgi:hypothetical protein